MNNSKISIIIPTFNRENVILRSINSVLNQTYKNIEVIIVDDGSTDNTETIISKINDKRLKYYKLNGNKGACYARNYGIKKSKGSYIAFQDSDDEFLPTKLEKQFNNLIKNKSDFDFCRINICYNDNHYSIPSNEIVDSFNKNGYVSELIKHNFISTQAILAKRELLIDENFDVRIPRLQDYDLVLRIATNYNISFTNEPLVNLYKCDNSIGNDYSKLKKTISIFSTKKYNITDDEKISLIDGIVNLLCSSIDIKHNEKILEYEHSINSLNNNVNDLNSCINHKQEQIYELNSNIEEKNRLIDSLSTKLSKKEDIIHKLKKGNNNLNKIINEDKNIISELNSKLTCILESKRWKLIDKLGNFKNSIFGKK